jgi:hypothetical protein
MTQSESNPRPCDTEGSLLSQVRHHCLQASVVDIADAVWLATHFTLGMSRGAALESWQSGTRVRNTAQGSRLPVGAQVAPTAPLTLDAYPAVARTARPRHRRSATRIHSQLKVPGKAEHLAVDDIWTPVLA